MRDAASPIVMLCELTSGARGRLLRLSLQQRTRPPSHSFIQKPHSDSCVCVCESEKLIRCSHIQPDWVHVTSGTLLPHPTRSSHCISPSLPHPVRRWRTRQLHHGSGRVVTTSSFLSGGRDRSCSPWSWSRLWSCSPSSTSPSQSRHHLQHLPPKTRINSCSLTSSPLLTTRLWLLFPKGISPPPIS